MNIASIDKDIEVYGSLKTILDGFKAFRPVAVKHMVACGVMASETDIADTGSWYPLVSSLHAYYATEQEAGPDTLFGVGEMILESATFPDTIVSVDSALRACDVAYHLNHRKSGVLMFDAATGAMTDGIGHYAYDRDGDERKITMVCSNPYRCSFDHGLLTAMARRFEPGATIAHAGQGACRASGSPECTYVVTW